MSRRRKKRQQSAVIEIVPVTPQKTATQLAWDQKLAAAAYAINDLARTHVEQVNELQYGKREVYSLAEQGLQETLEKCRGDRETYRQTNLSIYRQLRIKDDQIARLQGRLREISSIIDAVAGESGEIK